MTLPNFRRRASRSLSRGVVLVAMASSACHGRRPSFATLQQDAGGSRDETDVVDTTASDASTSPDPEGSSTNNERTPDSGDGDDEMTSPAVIGDIATEEASDGGPDVDPGSDTSTQDDGSVACPAGRYAADDGKCQAWTECEPGTYVASPGSASVNQECGACESETYSDVSNAGECLPWDNCGWFETSQAGTDTSNVECLQADRFDQFGTEEGDAIVAMAADASGRVVAVGYAGGALYSGAEGSAFVRLYDAQGGVEWTRQFGGESPHRLNGVSLELDGDVFIAGGIEGIAVESDPFPSDAFVQRLAQSDGKEVWRRQFGTGQSDTATAITTDANGSSVVVGNTSGELSTTSFGDSDVFVRQYGSTGEVHWTRQFGTDAVDYANAVAVGPGGYIAIVGSTYGNLSGETAGDRDGFLRVYTPDGTSQRTVQFGTESFDYAKVLTFTSSGDIAIAGPFQGSDLLRLYRLEESGELELVLVRTIDSPEGTSLSAVSAGASGNIVVAGNTSESLWADIQGGRDVFVQQYDARGEVLGGRQFGTDGSDYAMAVALVGGLEEHVLVAGYTSGALAGINAGGNDAFIGIIKMPAQTSR